MRAWKHLSTFTSFHLRRKPGNLPRTQPILISRFAPWPGAGIRAMSEQIQNPASPGKVAEQHGEEDKPAVVSSEPAAPPAAATSEGGGGGGGGGGGSEAPPMSKNALKRMRKHQEWEDGREDRAKKRKERRHDRKERYKEARDTAIAAAGGDVSSAVLPTTPVFRNKGRVPADAVTVPLALILDCDFEKYMTDKELISLTSQVVRSYSDNRGARYRAHLWVGGWRGKLRERFETTLRNSHQGWKGVGFCEGDFIQCAAEATQKMANPSKKGDVLVEPLQKSLDHPVQWVKDDQDPFPLPDPELEPKDEHKNIVYLSSESPYTLERLEPNTCYIVGGLVDKNREKGLCYRRARERGIRTAKLPIGKFMVMQSRSVLATNHVVEIMLKWLEFEDWGKAFTAVIPKRKGGTLRVDSVTGENVDEGEDGDDNDEEGVDHDQPAVASAADEGEAVATAGPSVEVKDELDNKS